MRNSSKLPVDRVYSDCLVLWEAKSVRFEYGSVGFGWSPRPRFRPFQAYTAGPISSFAFGLLSQTATLDMILHEWRKKTAVLKAPLLLIPVADDRTHVSIYIACLPGSHRTCIHRQSLFPKSLASRESAKSQYNRSRRTNSKSPVRTCNSKLRSCVPG
jgi:hypothetical protein